LWTAVLGLMVIGAAFIFSATGATDMAGTKPWWRFTVVNQVFAYGLGLAAAVILCIQPYHRFVRWSLVAYWISIALLLAVFVIGVDRLGATRWISLRVASFQPSEFAKLAFLLALANLLSRPAEELKSPVLFV